MLTTRSTYSSVTGSGTANGSSRLPDVVGLGSSEGDGGEGDAKEVGDGDDAVGAEGADGLASSGAALVTSSSGAAALEVHPTTRSAIAPTPAPNLHRLAAMLSLARPAQTPF